MLYRNHGDEIAAIRAEVAREREANEARKVAVYRADLSHHQRERENERTDIKRGIACHNGYEIEATFSADIVSDAEAGTCDAENVRIEKLEILGFKTIPTLLPGGLCKAILRLADDLDFEEIAE